MTSSRGREEPVFRCVACNYNDHILSIRIYQESFNSLVTNVHKARFTNQCLSSNVCKVITFIRQRKL